PMAVSIVLYQAVIKATKWDWLVEKASEIGVAALVPLITARTVVKPSGQNVLDRWKRIAVAAAKQSGRGGIMGIRTPQTLNEALAGLPKDGKALIPWEKEQTQTIRSVLSSSPAVSGISLFIGPEGGWETSEVELSKRQDVIPVRLGPTLLRSETAGIVASTL